MFNLEKYQFSEMDGFKVSDSVYTVSGSALRHPKGAVQEGRPFSVQAPATSLHM